MTGRVGSKGVVLAYSKLPRSISGELPSTPPGIHLLLLLRFRSTVTVDVLLRYVLLIVLMHPKPYAVPGKRVQSKTFITAVTVNEAPPEQSSKRDGDTEIDTVATKDVAETNTLRSTVYDSRSVDIIKAQVRAVEAAGANHHLLQKHESEWAGMWPVKIFIREAGVHGWQHSDYTVLVYSSLYYNLVGLEDDVISEGAENEEGKQHDTKCYKGKPIRNTVGLPKLVRAPFLSLLKHLVYL